MGDFEATGDDHCSHCVENMLKAESVKDGKFDYHDLAHIGMHQRDLSDFPRGMEGGSSYDAAKKPR